MGELLIILWFTLVCCMLAGFILGYLLGKARTTKQFETLPYTLQQVQEIMNENTFLVKENQQLIKELSETK